eukprot:8527796-Alexandrium_andersonii.AAC.1
MWSSATRRSPGSSCRRNRNRRAWATSGRARAQSSEARAKKPKTGHIEVLGVLADEAGAEEHAAPEVELGSAEVGVESAGAELGA